MNRRIAISFSLAVMISVIFIPIIDGILTTVAQEKESNYIKERDRIAGSRFINSLTSVVNDRQDRAKADLRTIYSAMIAYSSSGKTPGNTYAKTFTELEEKLCLPINFSNAPNKYNRGDYLGELSVSASGLEYTVVSNPSEIDEHTPSFYTDESGVIRYSVKGRASRESPEIPSPKKDEPMPEPYVVDKKEIRNNAILISIAFGALILFIGVISAPKTGTTKSGEHISTPTNE